MGRGGIRCATWVVAAGKAARISEMFAEHRRLARFVAAKIEASVHQ